MTVPGIAAVHAVPAAARRSWPGWVAVGLLGVVADVTGAVQAALNAPVGRPALPGGGTDPNPLRVDGCRRTRLNRRCATRCSPQQDLRIEDTTTTY